MVRFFGIALIFLMIFLAPPSVLALISNNAVPGDATYPIKRTLEAGILTIASVHPSVKAAFTVERSSRRFLEAKKLIDTGEDDKAVNTLDELIGQTKDAVKEVTNVPAGNSKKQLVKKLTEQVKTYDKELEKAQKKITSQVSYETPPQITTPVPTQSNSVQQLYNSPSTSSVPSPSPTSVQSPTPVPTKVDEIPASQTAQPVDLVQTIEETREELKEIQEELGNVDTGYDLEPPYETPYEIPAAEEAPPPVSSADEEPPAEVSEPQPIPTEPPVPTIEPTPEESPAIRIRKINQNNLNPTPEISSPPKV